MPQKFIDGVAGSVAGRDPLSLYDQLLGEWRSNGGDQLRTEFQQAYSSASLSARRAPRTWYTRGR